MQVPYVDLGAQWEDIRKEVLSEIDAVLKSGQYLDHPIIEKLEERLSVELGIARCVCVNSGTDALLLALHVLGIGKGDEVITVPNSFVASVAAIEHIGATTRFADVGPDHLIDVDSVESMIGPRTAAIMPVHLEGKVCNLTRLRRICDKHGLKLIEDAAQAIGASSDGVVPSQLSDIACFSLHPLKNLNGCGDGGFVSSGDATILNRIKALRNHGQKQRNLTEEFGYVSRMDSLQAAVISYRLTRLHGVIARRRHLADVYRRSLSYSKETQQPILCTNVFHTYHLYVVEVPRRNFVAQVLANAGIETRIHYPRLISEQPAFVAKYGEISSQTPNALKQCKQILSLPIHQHLSDRQVEYVAEVLCTAYE